MSWQLAALNRYLRAVEKPLIARRSLKTLRRSLELQANLFFHAPWGSRFRRETLAGVPVQWATGPGASGSRVILYLHGGAYVLGSSGTHRAMVAKISALTGLPAVLPDYRLAPEHPFPAAFDDAVACYCALCSDHDVILGGDSAGGGLALAVLAYVLGADLPRPKGLFAFSPLTDMTYSGASVATNAERDALLSTERIAMLTGLVLGSHDPRDVRISPLFASFVGAPPIWLTVGDTEFLLDDTTRLHDALSGQGVDSTLSVLPDHPHVWPIFFNVLPEARRSLRQLSHWIGAL